MIVRTDKKSAAKPVKFEDLTEGVWYIPNKDVNFLVIGRPKTVIFISQHGKAAIASDIVWKNQEFYRSEEQLTFSN
jgi:hypothetical protein